MVVAGQDISDDLRGTPMALIKTVENLTRGAVGTAVTVARHPIGTTANVIGFAKGVAGAGIGLVRPSHEVPEQRVSEPVPAEPVSAEPASSEAASTEESRPASTPERDLPGPDIVLAEPPDPADLPEPIVIEADDSPGPEVHEAFHHEPHATTRSDSIGGEAGDVFEAVDEADVALEDLNGNQ